MFKAITGVLARRATKGWSINFFFPGAGKDILTYTPKRNNVKLESVPKSDKEDTANFTLEQNGGDIILKKNNSFSHDNVD